MFILFFVLWIVFNGKITLEISVFGLFISLALYVFSCKFMGYSISKDLRYISKVPLFLYYVVVLLWEILKANLNMAKILVVKQEYELKPVIFKIKTNLKSNMGKTLLANSITLTPGTITIDVRDDELIIHAVDRSLMINEGFVFEKILLKLEGGNK